MALNDKSKQPFSLFVQNKILFCKCNFMRSSQEKLCALGFHSFKARFRIQFELTHFSFLGLAGLVCPRTRYFIARFRKERRPAKSREILCRVDLVSGSLSKVSDQSEITRNKNLKNNSNP